MPRIQADDGVHLAYKVRGDGPLNVVFAHGWAGSAAYWDQTIEGLGLAGLRLATVDLRGHGESDAPTPGLTLDRLSQDLWTVADALPGGKLVLVGFSMSAKFVQHAASLRPDRVAGLVLVAGCPASQIPFPPETHQDWVGRAGDRGRLKEVTAMFLTRPVAPEVLDRWAEDAARVPRHVLDETLAECVRQSFADRLRTLRMPVLVVGGRHDPIFTPDVMHQGVVGPLPRARLVLLESNHEVPIEAPRELALAVESFLAGLG